MTRLLLAGLVFGLVACGADAQINALPPGMPPQLPVPHSILPPRYPAMLPGPRQLPDPVLPNLLFVRFSGPVGAKITFFRSANGQTFDVPCTIGLRPGYRYRAQISDVPGFPQLVLSPTLEVRG